MPAARLVRASLRALWWLATLATLGLVAYSLVHSVTWYLAVDQYGYLTFAHDLMHGRIFHHSPPLDALGPTFTTKADVLVQSYVYDRGKVYCRYAPGFAMVLAAWIRVLGDDAAHSLAPVVFLLLLALVIAFVWRVTHSAWRGTAAALLVILCPTTIMLWAITLVRDLPTHLAGLLGLYLLLPAGAQRLVPGRAAAAGLALGFAGSIRPDAMTYLVPAGLLAFGRWWHEGRGASRLAKAAVGGALGVLVGLAPFFTYNWIATGSPFRPTQGMEIEQFFPPSPAPPAVSGAERVGFPSGLWHGGTLEAVQGGGLRLTNFRHTLPAILSLLRGTYGDALLGLAVWGALLAALRHRFLFLAAVPYVAVAVVFFSFWLRPDWRYLAGVAVVVPMLMVEGALGAADLARRLARSGRTEVARLVALTVAGGVLVGAALASVPRLGVSMPKVVVVVAAAAAATALGAALWPRRRVDRWTAPALVLALLGIFVWRAMMPQPPARFQRAQMLRSRAAFATAVEPNAVVITTEDVGRPAENIDYYSGRAYGLYFTDLRRWGLTPAAAAALLAKAGLKPYLLIPFKQPDRDELLADLRQSFDVEQVADIPPAEAIDYFVAAAFYPNGIRMLLFRLRPHGS